MIILNAFIDNIFYYIVGYIVNYIVSYNWQFKKRTNFQIFISA